MFKDIKYSNNDNQLFKYNITSNTSNKINIKSYMKENMSYWEKYLQSIKNNNLTKINIRSKL